MRNIQQTRAAIMLLLVLAILVSAIPAVAEAGANLPICEPGEVTLTMLTFQNWDSTSYYDSEEGLPVENKIEEIIGVHIIYECVSSDDYEMVAQTRLAAGINLPDIIRLPKSQAGMAKYADSGLLINMSDYISEQNTPYIWKLFEEQPIHKAYCTAADGNIYGLPYCEYGVSNVVVFWNSIRKDWLDKLGLEMPTTIEEYHDVLVAFRDLDPNGNGQQDEVPQCYLNDSMYGLYSFKNAFGLPATDVWSISEVGDVQLDLVDPRFRECLTEMNKWYNEGLLYPEASGSGWQDLCALDRMGAQTLVSADNLLTYNSFCYPVNPDCNYIYLPLLKSEKYPDHQPKISKRGSWHDYYSVTVDCENPDVAVRWLDWVWASEESQTLRYYGFEGETYEVVDGVKKFLPVVTESEKGSIGYLRGLGAFPNFVGRESGECFLAMYPGKYPETAYNEYKDFMVDRVSNMIGTVEEMDAFTRIWPDLELYLKESVVGFITGSKSLDEWDSYVDTCNQMGLQELLKIKKDWNDRLAGF